MYLILCQNGWIRAFSGMSASGSSVANRAGPCRPEWVGWGFRVRFLLAAAPSRKRPAANNNCSWKVGRYLPSRIRRCNILLTWNARQPCIHAAGADARRRADDGHRRLGFGADSLGDDGGAQAVGQQVSRLPVAVGGRAGRRARAHSGGARPVPVHLHRAHRSVGQRLGRRLPIPLPVATIFSPIPLPVASISSLPRPSLYNLRSRSYSELGRFMLRWQDHIRPLAALPFM